MGVSPHQWPSHPETVAQVAALGGSVAAWAQSKGVPVSTAKDHIRRHGLRPAIEAAVAGNRETLAAELADIRQEAEQIQQQVSKAKTGEQKPYTEVKGDSATFVTPPSPELGKIEDMIRDAGLDPAEWDVERTRLNFWDALASGGSEEKGIEPRVVRLYQMRVDLKPKVRLDWLFPAVDVAPRPAPRNPHVALLKPEEPQRVVFFPDQHAPYHDERLHYAAMQHLEEWQPHRIVNLGDLCDFPTISRHRDNPAYFASASACAQGGFQILSDQRAAAPDAFIDLIEGNHDARPRTELLTRAERMFDLRAATWPGEEPPAHPWSLQHLLHLDRLHVNFVGPELEGDNYFQGVLELADALAAVHGFISGSSSASTTVERLGQSVFFGHTHRQKVHHVTKYKGKDPVAEWVGVECGTMRGIKGGGGFAFNPNWQQGFATATVWPDGEFTYDLARFDGKTLTWRDKRYR